MHGLLAGSLGGLLYSSGTFGQNPWRRMPFRISFWIAVTILITGVLLAPQRAMFVLRGWTQLVTLASVVVVIGAVFAQSRPMVIVLGGGPLAYFGRRSYALYLWHLPIGLVLRQLGAVEHLLIVGGLSLLAAEISYRLIERPALRWKDRFSARRPEAAAQAAAAPPADAA